LFGCHMIPKLAFPVLILSQVIAKNKFNIAECEDFVWVTKDELIEYFPEHAEFFNKMIIS